MSRTLLVSAIISAVGKNHPNLTISQAAADTIVKSVTETIHASLKTNGHFSLQGFGTFRVAYVILSLYLSLHPPIEAS